jgi:uncharacterized damage-inducible protein DinB
MSPEQTGTKMSLGNMLAAELSQEAISARKMLERIPFEFIAWKPHEKSTEIGHLAHHIARLPSFVKAVLTTDEFDLAASGYKPPVLTGTNELVESFDNVLAEAVELLNTVSDEDLAKTWRLRNGEKTIFEMARAGVVRTLVLSHLIHHRGQLSVYLRLQNVPVPSIYGPSADEQ